MRVAIFGESYLPYLSGVTVSTDALARGLELAGHEVLLVVPGTSGSTAGAVTAAWLPSYQLPRLVPSGYRMPWPVPSTALTRARGFRPDIVHAQSPFVSGAMARAVARRTGAPLVFTHHTRFADYRHYLGRLAVPGAWAVDAYLRSFWRGCAAVIAPSASLAAEIRARLEDAPRPLVRIVPTGVDVEQIRRLPTPDLRAYAGWPADALVVASLGRLAPEKSVTHLVDAFERAAGDDRRLRLLLIGGGPQQEELRHRAAAGDRIHLSGPLPHRDALGLLKGADLFAFASRTETQGLVLAEALACGLPVVAMRGPGVDESVRDGVDGRLVGSVEELAAAIVDLAAAPQRRAELAAAALAGASRFALDRRIAEVVSVYRDVLGEPA